MLQAIARPTRRMMMLVAPIVVALGLLASTGTAQAEWHYTKGGAQKITKDFVSGHYDDTYFEDLTARCRPQGMSYDPDYKYHRWVCHWRDYSDNTAGTVLIVGSNVRGRYYWRVLS
jgi:hypothetical protein